MAQEFIISEIAQVSELINDIKLFNSQRKKVHVAIAALSVEQNEHLEQQVNEYYSACGCAQGRTAGVITFIVYFILVFSGIISFYELGILRTILLYFLCSFITMLIAKIYGQRQARTALLKLAGRQLTV